MVAGRSISGDFIAHATFGRCASAFLKAVLHDDAAVCQIVAARAQDGALIEVEGNRFRYSHLRPKIKSPRHEN